jgi:enterochelin esterase-like enzyme
MKRVLLSVAALGLAALLQRGNAGSDAPWREGVPSPRIERLRQQVGDGGSKAVEDFWRQVKAAGTPLVEDLPGDPGHALVTFLYRGTDSTTRVALISQLTASRDPSVNTLTHLAGTDVWYKTYLLRSDMRLSYGFVPNPTDESLSYANRETAQSSDPLNPKTVSAQANIGHSLLELPGAPPQSAVRQRPSVVAGKLSEESLTSTILKAERRAWVYTPPHFDPNRPTPYPVLICFDGWVYTRPEFIPTPTILDNLIADGKIPPMVGVFIDQAPQPQRNVELGNNESFLNFVTGELLPRVRKKWNATSDPRQTIVCGSSAGGLASAFFAFRRPDVFGNVISQSGAFWPGHTREDPDREWLTRQYEASPKLPVRFVLQVGLLEIVATPGNGPSILAANRHLRDVLTTKGYEITYREVSGGHEPLSWSGGLAEGLIQLSGAKK